MLKLSTLFSDIYVRFLNGKAIRYNLADLQTYAGFLLSQLSPPTKASYIITEISQIETIVISLPFRADRRSYISRHFVSHGIPFRFFDAIHGSIDLHKTNATINFSKSSQKFLSAGSMGCIASHITVWTALLHSGTEAYLVFEDDVTITNNYNEIMILMQQVPQDFDVVYLGSRSIKTILNLRKISGCVYRPFSIRKGAYGYLISKKGAAKLLKETKEIKITCGGIDTILGIASMRNKIITYHIKPGIAGVNFSLTSNIRNFSDTLKPLHQTEY